MAIAALLHKTQDSQLASRGIPSLRVIHAVLVLGILALSGCGTFLPSDGPSAARIKKEAKNGSNEYVLIPLTSQVVHAIKGTESYASSGTPSDSRVSLQSSGKLPKAAPQTIALGDVVRVTIYETGGALFEAGGASGGNEGSGGSKEHSPAETTGSFGHELPPQTVDSSGAITVPFAGRIRVKGSYPHEVEAKIREGLQGKAIDPQVIVTVGDRYGGNLVTVAGDVKQPKQVAIGYAGSRLLDVVTAAGGSTGRPEDTTVSLHRGALTRSASLLAVTNDAAQNLSLQPDDTVTVKVTPRTFLAFGANGKNGRYIFDMAQVSLADALADAGGLMDSRSNPAAVYVYRLEPRGVMARLDHPPAEAGGETPVIYNLNLTSPTSFFLAQNFEIQNKDIIFVSNAGSVGLAKFISLINSTISSVSSQASTAASYTVR